MPKYSNMAGENLPRILIFLSAEHFHLALIVTFILASLFSELTTLKSKTNFSLPVPEVTDVDAGV